MGKATNKRNIVSGLILLVILIVYNLLFFIIPFNRELSKTAYWITYAFTWFFSIAMFFIVVLGFGDKKLRSRVFGIPIVLAGTIALICQFLIDLLIMIIGNWISIKGWIPSVIEIVLFGGLALSLIVRKAYKDVIVAKDVKEEDKEAFIRALRKDMEILRAKFIPEGLIKGIERLDDAIRYTIPASRAEVNDLEEEITDQMIQLKNELAAGDEIKAKRTIDSLISSIKERQIALTK